MFSKNSQILDIKYLNILSTSLRNFKWKSSNLAVCSCPICGDSVKDTAKARGYFFFKDGRMIFKCHNCSVSMRFFNFLKKINGRLGDEYTVDSLKNREMGKLSHPVKLVVDETAEKYKELSLKPNHGMSHCIPLRILTSNHPAISYLNSRRIPREIYDNFYFSSEFKKLVHGLNPDKKIPDDDGRIVIPFLDPDGNMIGFQGRAVSPDNEHRYVTISLTKNYPMWYGLNEVDTSRDVFIVEGVFDAVFIPNSIAVLTSSVSNSMLYQHIPKEHCVFMNDNEPRNPSICKIIRKHIDEENKVCFLPDFLLQYGKDVNDVVLSDFPPDRLVKIIKKNVYRGPEAMMRFFDWKRVSYEKDFERGFKYVGL